MVRPAAERNETRDELEKRVPGLSRLSFSARELQIERVPGKDVCETTILTDRFSVFTIPLTPLHQNCRLLRCEKTGECALIDPGAGAALLKDTLEHLKPDVSALLVTHAHPDHCGGLMVAKNLTGATVYGHPHWFEKLMLVGVEPFKWVYKFKDDEMKRAPLPDVSVRNGDTISVGDLKLKALHTPGHSPGHLAFYLPDEGVLFSGDLLFREYLPHRGSDRVYPAITRIPGGNKTTYVQSIKEVLRLPEDTLVFSGHNDDFTMAQMQGSSILDKIERM